MLEDRIDSLQLAVFYAATSGQPAPLSIQRAWVDLPQHYNDAFGQLKQYLFVKGWSFLKRKSLPLDTEEVGEAVSETLKSLWKRHADGKVVEAAHMLNYAETTLWRGTTKWRQHQQDVGPILVERAYERWAQGIQIPIDAPLHAGEEDETPTLGETLKDEQAETPEAAALADQLHTWDQQVAQQHSERAAQARAYHQRAEKEGAPSLKKLAESCEKQARTWLGLRLYLRRQLLYAVDHSGVTEQLFDRLFGELSHRVSANRPWDRCLDQAIT